VSPLGFLDVKYVGRTIVVDYIREYRPTVKTRVGSVRRQGRQYIILDTGMIGRWRVTDCFGMPMTSVCTIPDPYMGSARQSGVGVCRIL
jgi:hypothetical protein